MKKLASFKFHDDDFDVFLKESEHLDSSMSRYLTCTNAKEEKSDVKEYEEERKEWVKKRMRRI